jgi:antitoxin ParD1/3/4
MTITLSEAMRAKVEERVKAAGYASTQDYIVALIENDLDEEVLLPPGYVPPAEITPRNREELEAMLIEGLNSGPPIRVTPEFWEERKRVLEERMAKRRGESK